MVRAIIYRRADIVGPKVCQELFHDGVVATLLAVLMIAIYVSVRFEWQYGIGAAVATGHDVLVTAGLFSLLHLDFTLTRVAALLTLAGYSINDTVVVFDRIRENRRKFKRMPLAESHQLSTNQTLTRTVLTTAATAISILPLLLFGGPTCSILARQSSLASWSAPSRRSMSPPPCCSTCPRQQARSKNRRRRGKYQKLHPRTLYHSCPWLIAGGI